jgi:hypothetical protein
VITTRFNFHALANGTIQLTTNPELEHEGQLVSEKILAIMRGLGQLQFVAAGLNFIWHEGEDEESVNRLSRRLFFRQGIIPFTYFSEPDARFGGYMSKDYRGLRLKLDIKPILAQKPTESVPQHKLNFSFNFHKDIDAENPLASVEQALALWDEAKAYAENITTLCVRGGD